jgi:ubiquinone/menaquinone biosynthesis C-methylase UbiE
MTEVRKGEEPVEPSIWDLKGRARRRQERRAQVTAWYLQPKERDVILDVGCGDGFMDSYFSKAGFVVGLELSCRSLEVAKRKVPKGNVQFVCADARFIPLRSESVDKVAVLEVLEHLPVESQQMVCREVDRVLKKGGVLVVTVPYKEEIVYTRCIHCGKLTPLWGHLHSMDVEKVSKLLPPGYVLVAKAHFPNLEFVSISEIFHKLSFTLWLIINNLLGIIKKGYWILLKYKKF